QIAFAASEISDVDGRKQKAQRACPRRPRSARHELTALISGKRMRRKTFAAQPPHFLEPRVIGARLGRPTLQLVAQPACELRTRPIARGKGIRGAVPAEATRAFFRHEARVTKQSEVARHT